MSRASKAPPPIKPLSPSLTGIRGFNREVSGAANWKYWKHVETVEIWQGLLLSLDIEPTGGGWLIRNAPGGPGDIPYEYLDNHGLTDEYLRRWFLLQNRLETLNARAGRIVSIKLTDFLGLPVLAALALEFEWESLPEAFVTLGRSLDQSPRSAASSVSPEFPQPGIPAADTTERNPRADADPLVPKATAKPATTVHKASSRSNPLDAVIRKAKELAVDPDDRSSVWAALIELAKSSDRPAPLVGFVEEEGVKYQTESGIKFFTQKNFRDRERRARAR